MHHFHSELRNVSIVSVNTRLLIGIGHHYIEVDVRFEKRGHSRGHSGEKNNIYDLVNDICDLLVKEPRSKRGAPVPSASPLDPPLLYNTKMPC